MSIRELHWELHIGKLKMLRSDINERYSLDRPTFIESLVKHPGLPKYFGNRFDEIMGPQFGLDDAKAKIRFSELGRSQPDTALLMERAMIQRLSICNLIEDAEKWIGRNDKSFRHQGNLEAIVKNFADFFEQGDKYDYGWDRLVDTIRTLFNEEFIPTYQQSHQLKKRCFDIIKMIDAGPTPRTETERNAVKEKLTKPLDDLQWYFDNFCVGQRTTILSADPPDQAPVLSKAPRIAQPKEECCEIGGITISLFSGLMECNGYSKPYRLDTQIWTIVHRCALSDPPGAVNVDFLTSQGKTTTDIDGILKDANTEWKEKARCRILRRDGDMIYLGKISVQSQNDHSLSTEHPRKDTVQTL